MKSKLLLLFFTFSFLFVSDQSFDQDLGRHLKLGEIIVKTGQIPKTNLFSYTNPDFPFINTHWLFEVIAFLASQTIGLQFLLILKVIIFLISVFLILKLIPDKNSLLLIPIGFIFLHVLRERLELRPEILSFLFTALTLFILEKFLKKEARLIFTLPLIQLIWINTHIYFFVGLLLQVIFMIHLLIQYIRIRVSLQRLKILIAIFLLSVVVSLINPNGLKGFLFPMTVTGNYGYTIVENQTMFFLENIHFSDPNFIYVKIAMGIIILSLVVSLIKRSFSVKDYLLALSGMGLSLLNVRSFPYLIFLSLPSVITNFGSIKYKNFFRFLSIIFIIILIVESYNYLSGKYYLKSRDSHFPELTMQEDVKGSMDYVIANDLPTPIFNNFDIGSYITYRGYPKYKVFVDGRPEAYPKEFFTNTYIPMQYDYKKFKDGETKWSFKTIIFSHTDQTPWAQTFLKSLIKDATWKLVYIDDLMLVLVKDNILVQKHLIEINLSNLSPDSYNFDNFVSYLRISNFLTSTENNQSAQQFLQKAGQVYRKNPAVNSL